jgi:hypothetical protein
MFGINNTGVVLGLGFTLCGALICIIYGIKNWNTGNSNENETENSQNQTAEKK